MFTGIIEATANVRQKSDTQLTLERPALFDDIKTGSSIAVSGVCLSVVAFDDRSMTFDVVPETWSKTNLGDAREGDRMNVERALAASGRFEGHVVQGHIEGTGRVVNLQTPDGSPWATLTVELPEEIARYVVYKGSIAINGVSLTVASKEGTTCTIALIPHTLSMTNLGTLTPGMRVNIETDVLARYLESLFSTRS